MGAETLSDSRIFEPKNFAQTSVYALNIALSGSLFGGVSYGITSLAAPSRHFKSGFAIIMAKAYLDKYDDAVVLFYDSENGIPRDYWLNVGIDPERVVRIPIMNIEGFKFDIMNQFENNLNVGDHAFILVDSAGNLASKKEVDDAVDEKSVADMTRAKAFKSLFRIITPYINKYELPMVVINHVYDEIGLYPKTIMGGGTGPMLASNEVLFIGKVKVKDGKDLKGNTFKIKTEKSRFVIEQSVIPITLEFGEDISPYTGLLDIAISTGDIEKPNLQRYKPRLIDKETGEIVEDDKTYYRKDIETNPEFWEEIMFKRTAFESNVEKMYKL